MQRFVVSSVLWILAATGATSAYAQSKEATQEYEIMAYEAEDVRGSEPLAAVLWPYLATCENVADAYQKRQCLAVRDARRVQLAGRTFRVSGDRLTFSPSDFDAEKKALTVKLYECIACAQPVAIDGVSRYVLGTGAERTVFGTTVLGAMVRAAAVPVADEAGAARWKADVAPRLRTELVFRVPAQDQAWQQGGTDGFSVEIVGYRVHDPCTGAVIVSRPRSSPVAKDPSTCTGEDLLALERARQEAEKPRDTGPTGPVLPEKLTPVDIQEALKAATLAAEECHAIYGVAGEAKFRIAINRDGAVTGIEQEGYFADTPTGDCIAAAVKAAKFPKTQQESTTVNYPFVLH